MIPGFISLDVARGFVQCYLQLAWMESTFPGVLPAHGDKAPLSTFLFFVSENLPFWDGRDLQRSSCVPEIFPPKRLPCATGALCTSWTVHTHKVGYFKLLKFCGASLAQGGDPGLPEKKKVDVMNQIFCKGVAVLTTF